MEQAKQTFNPASEEYIQKYGINDEGIKRSSAIVDPSSGAQGASGIQGTKLVTIELTISYRIVESAVAGGETASDPGAMLSKGTGQESSISLKSGAEGKK